MYHREPPVYKSVISFISCLLPASIDEAHGAAMDLFPTLFSFLLDRGAGIPIA